MYIRVQESTENVPLDTLSFHRLLDSTFDLPSFLCSVPGLTLDPSRQRTDVLYSCLRYNSARYIRIDHTASTCEMLEMLVVYDYLDIRHLDPGVLYTFVADIINGRFRIRFKPRRFTGEIGSKHICLIDDTTRHIVLAGEVKDCAGNFFFRIIYARLHAGGLCCTTCIDAQLADVSI